MIRNVGWNTNKIIRILVALQILNAVCVGQSTSPSENNDDFQLNYTVTSRSIEFQENYEGFTLIKVKCSSIGDVSTRTASNICNDLEPCTQYYISAEVLNLTSNLTFNKEDVIKTSYEAPDAEFDVIIPHPTSIFISWTNTNRKCISKVVIRADSDSTQYKTEISDGKEHIEVSDLQPCRKYTIKLSVEDDTNTEVSSISNVTETDFTDPGPIQNTTITAFKNDSVIVTWHPPHYSTCAYFYYITWKNLNCTLMIDECTKAANISASEQQYTIQNLDGCLEYSLSIDVNGNQINSSFYDEFSTKSQAPGPVRNLREIYKGPTNVTVQWDPPEKNSFCLMSYIVSISNEEKSYETVDTEWTFTNLEPCGKYTIEVATRNDEDEESEKSQLEVTLLTDTPSPVIFDLNNTAVHVHEILLIWNPPVYAPLCSKYYRIVLWYTDNLTHDYDNQTEDNFISINNLLSCMTYTVQVISVTGGDQPLESLPAQISLTTKGSVPLEPNAPEEWGKTSTSLHLATFSTDTLTNCVILYVRVTCDANQPAPIMSTRIDMEVNNLAIVRYEVVVEPLSPATKYECRFQTYNMEGWSKEAKGLFETEAYYPEPPINIQATTPSSTEINVRWHEPRTPNGKVGLYKIHIQPIRAKYPIPSYCTPIELESTTQLIEAPKMEFLFQAAHPYVEYSVQVSAINEFGASDFSSPVRITTLPSYSEPVLYFSAATLGPKLSQEYEANVTLHWSLPCRSNGEIISFQGIFFGVRDDYPTDIFDWQMHVNSTMLIESDAFDWVDTRLKPEYNYSVTISVVVLNQTQNSRVMSAKFVAPSGIPPIPPSVDVDVDAFEANNPTTSAVLKFPKNVFISDMGNILFVALLISEEACRQEQLTKYALIESEKSWPEVDTWGQVKDKSCMTLYQTTPVQWKVEAILRENPQSDFVEYTIGKNSCENVDKNFFCNGPLRPGSSYSIILRLFTSSGYSDTGYYTFKTDSAVQMYFILLLIISCLFVAFLLGFIYLWVTKKIIWHGEQFRGGEETSGDISSKNFFDYYDEIAKSEKVHREFKELTAISNELNLSNVASTSNETKNRYSNVFPYDKNRVILDCDADGADYINASFINGYKRKKEYIATQGPKPESFIDFWRMILQHNVRLIVMVTQMKEGEIVKCHQYFPILNKEMAFGHNITVSCRREAIHPNYERRELILEHRNELIKTNVIHYYFKKWPDHDCPDDASDLIQFVRKIRSEKIKKHSPITVHCSAGVGRTGTFIGLDIIMQRLKYENRINIFDTVKELRFQRMKMVQTLQQYQFLYNCTYQLVKKKYAGKTKDTTVKKPQTSQSNGIIQHHSLSTPIEAESIM